MLRNKGAGRDTAGGAVSTTWFDKTDDSSGDSIVTVSSARTDCDTAKCTRSSVPLTRSGVHAASPSRRQCSTGRTHPRVLIEVHPLQQRRHGARLPRSLTSV
jgi:hypothetical protein